MLDEDPLPLFPEAPRTPPLRAATVAELEHAIARAIGSAGRALSRGTDLHLSGLCARLIADQLLLAGFIIALPNDAQDDESG